MFPLTQVKNDIELDGFHSIYYFEFGKDYYHLPENHDYWEMVYVDKGEIIALSDGKSSKLCEGQAIFHKPGEMHAHTSNGEVANNMLVVSFSCNSECMTYFENKSFALDKTLKTLLSLFLKEAENALGKISNNYYDKTPLDFSNGKFGSAQLVKFHFTEFLIKLLRGKADMSSNISDTRQVSQDTLAEMIVAYMKNNIYSQITLNDICDNFFLRKSQISIIFKEYTGKSPMRYYADLKVGEAKKLLREDILSVSEISEKLNYSGIHNFSRAFKEVTGFSPMGYKKSILSYTKTE
ncbi:MAG: helix-turn-helix domain-containing protein [Clostridia bacterium]|nr:helix-turn-helix domain-containing protein [Clostridia bacterium]